MLLTKGGKSNKFCVCLNRSSCPCSPVLPLQSPCSFTASWALRKRIDSGQRSFPTPLPSKINGPTPMPAACCWGGTGSAARGLVILCARSVVGTGPGTEKNTRDGRKKRTNGTWRPSLREALDRFAVEKVWVTQVRCRDFRSGVWVFVFLLKSDSYSSAKALASKYFQST